MAFFCMCYCMSAGNDQMNFAARREAASRTVYITKASNVLALRSCRSLASFPMLFLIVTAHPSDTEMLRKQMIVCIGRTLSIEQMPIHAYGNTMANMYRPALSLFFTSFLPAIRMPEAITSTGARMSAILYVHAIP